MFGTTVANALPYGRFCYQAERMWILWHPPYAYNTQRLSEKWTACGDLPEFTSRGPQEAIHVFRMSSKNGVMSKSKHLRGERTCVSASRPNTSSLASRTQTFVLTCQLSSNRLRLSRRRAPLWRHRRLPRPRAGELRLPAESSGFWSERGEEGGEGDGADWGAEQVPRDHNRWLGDPSRRRGTSQQPTVCPIVPSACTGMCDATKSS